MSCRNTRECCHQRVRISTSNGWISGNRVSLTRPACNFPKIPPKPNKNSSPVAHPTPQSPAQPTAAADSPDNRLHFLMEPPAGTQQPVPDLRFGLVVRKASQSKTRLQYIWRIAKPTEFVGLCEVIVTRAGSEWVVSGYQRAC